MKVSKLQILYLSALSMLGFISTDIYLPAFGAMQDYFNTEPKYLALSLTVFLLGMGVGQIAWGVISDRFGFRRSLLAGLFIFSLASFGLAASETVTQLLAFRFVQAIGVCAPAVIWQAMVISRYNEKTSQQLFSTIMPLVALSPALAPLLGVALLNAWGWQVIFTLLTLIGIGLFALTLKQPQDSVQIKSSQSFLSDIGSLVKSKTFMGNITIFAFASAVFFSYLTGMPEIMGQLGYSAGDIGMSFIPQTIAFIVGGYVGKRALQKHSDENLLIVLLTLFSLASVSVFIVCQWQLTSIWPILIPFCLVAMTNGALYPIVVNRALSSAKHCASTAAGFQNSFQILVSSLASSVVAALISNAQNITGLVIFVCMLGTWLGFVLSHSKLSMHFTVPDNAKVGNPSSK